MLRFGGTTLYELDESLGRSVSSAKAAGVINLKCDEGEIELDQDNEVITFKVNNSSSASLAGKFYGHLRDERLWSRLGKGSSGNTRNGTLRFNARRTTEVLDEIEEVFTNVKLDQVVVESTIRVVGKYRGRKFLNE